MADKKYEILTLREDTAGQTGHWQQTQTAPYGNEDNESIVESNSAKTTEPTSIPSPFARMELARTAFDIAAEVMSKQGKSWSDVPRRYQKIVSDCLDVAEIFFNFPLYKEYFRIIKWSKQQDLVAMKNTELGKSMAKFMVSDEESYHFDRMDAIYLLDYIGKNRINKTGLNIVGATSPITLFFSVDNDLSYVSETINFNQDKPFDGSFNPLEKRDLGFIKYMHLLRKQYNADPNVKGSSFAKDFKEVNNYITAACNFVTDANAISGNYSYDNVEAGNADYVRVLEFPIGCQSIKKPEQSDFEIASDTELARNYRPLILPVESANGFDKCRYINDSYLWGDKNLAPVMNTTAWKQRVLPAANVQYPYLTLGDFFTDKIVKMPYELNSDYYFDGNLTQGSTTDSSYLLPFKPLLFELFSVKEIQEKTEFTVKGSVVEVTLKLPIRNYTGKATNSFVKYVKKYQTNANTATNVGEIVNAKFGLGVFPLVRTKDIQVAHYRIAMYDKEGNAKVKFYDSTSNKSVGIEQPRKHRDTSAVCSIETYVVEKQNFDRIAVTINGETGYVFPLFKEGEGAQAFKFAVDLGTTNTHIAYNVTNMQDTSAFEMKVPQMVKLHKDYKQDRGDIAAAFVDCFMPDSIGVGGKYKFPIRSAFAEDQRIDYRDNQYTLADGNIPFRYEEIGAIPYLNIKTDEELKWTAEPQRLALFIRNIVYMLHNKVLMENGQLSKTEIIWFYPASMSTGLRNNMADAWDKAYKDFFDADYDPSSPKMEAMSESIAPYCYFKEKDGAVGIVATIDVGGGTTDVYVSDGKDENGYLSSFRFASNSIFGDGYNNNISNNGFVRKYHQIFADALRGESELSGALNTIYQKGKSTDLISFFFSLASTGKPGLDFMNMLKEDQRYKYVFVYFYSAILYNVANSMKAKGIAMPHTVAFSGNGSKTLQVLSSRNDVLTDFVKRIFEKVYGQTYPSTIKFVLKYNNENPKEATSLGGLAATAQQTAAKPQDLILLGTDTKKFVGEEQFDNISDKVKDDIISSVEEFISFVSSLNKDNYFGEQFLMDVNVLPQIEEFCHQNLKEYLDLGLDKITKLLSSDPTRTTKINESLFFYPLVGMLNNLAQELYGMEN